MTIKVELETKDLHLEKAIAFDLATKEPTKDAVLELLKGEYSENTTRNDRATSPTDDRQDT